MQEFTYRSARSGSLVVGLGLAIAVEAAVLHLWLRPTHPVLAWSATLSSLSVVAWLWADYRALGRGAIRVGFDAVDVWVGTRVGRSFRGSFEPTSRRAAALTAPS
jgi:hypothetical protein